MTGVPHYVITWKNVIKHFSTCVTFCKSVLFSLVTGVFLITLILADCLATLLTLSIYIIQHLVTWSIGSQGYQVWTSRYPTSNFGQFKSSGSQNKSSCGRVEREIADDNITILRENCFSHKTMHSSNRWGNRFFLAKIKCIIRLPWLFCVCSKLVVSKNA